MNLDIYYNALTNMFLYLQYRKKNSCTMIIMYCTKNTECTQSTQYIRTLKVYSVSTKIYKTSILQNTTLRFFCENEIPYNLSLSEGCANNTENIWKEHMQFRDILESSLLKFKADVNDRVGEHVLPVRAAGCLISSMLAKFTKWEGRWTPWQNSLGLESASSYRMLGLWRTAMKLQFNAPCQKLHFN